MADPPRKDLAQALAALREEYLRAAPARLDELDAAIVGLFTASAERAVLERAMRHFHALAGSGATYGLPGVTELARPVDEEIRDLLKSGRTPDLDAVRRWAETVRRIRGEFSLSVPGGAPAPLHGGHRAEARDGRTVLVVDDDPAFRDTLRVSLAEEGYVLRMAGDRKEALSVMGSGLPDALIADILLPDGSGLDLVEHVRSRPGGDRVAVLAVSVRTGFRDKVEAIHAGADAFFEKPLDIDALKRRLRQSTRGVRGSDVPRVLSVEDDPHQADFIRTVLETGGFHVTTCADPDSFESHLISSQPDLVLMDADLPGPNGYDLTRYLRIEERFATLPVVFLTGQGDEWAKIEAVRAGGDDHLVKPVTPGLLLSTVAARIERARFLKGLLYRDGLTQLYTRAAFLERARIVHAHRTRRGGGRAALVILDLDHFKEVNDRHGHLAGDYVLASFAAMLRKRLRKADTIGRIGGEEFAIVIEDLDRDDAVRLVELSLRGFAEMEHTSPEGTRFRLTCSGGVAPLEARHQDVGAWLRAADDALYRAKAAGRNRVEVNHAEPPSP